MPQKTCFGSVADRATDAMAAGLRETLVRRLGQSSRSFWKEEPCENLTPLLSTNGQDRPEIDQKKIDRIILNYF
jgi:hypothetical protein